LELIRSQLIWAEQNQETGKISLRALTDVPAEEAVREAIMRIEAAEATREQQPTPAPAEELPAEPDLTTDKRVETEQEPQLPIPIVEIPPADAPATGQQTEAPQGYELPTRISELPAKNSSRRQADELEPLNGQTTE
jgi:hypothetical protein